MMQSNHNPSERRRYPRTQINMTLQITRLDPDGTVDSDEPLQMVDISRGGIGAVSSRAFYPGQRVVLKLPAPGMGVRNVCATVRRCGKSSDQHYVGFEFDSPIFTASAEAVPAAVAAAA